MISNGTPPTIVGDQVLVIEDLLKAQLHPQIGFSGSPGDRLKADKIGADHDGRIWDGKRPSMIQSTGRLTFSG